MHEDNLRAYQLEKLRGRDSFGESEIDGRILLK
jgi:hypothetical protein